MPDFNQVVPYAPRLSIKDWMLKTVIFVIRMQPAIRLDCLLGEEGLLGID